MIYVVSYRVVFVLSNLVVRATPLICLYERFRKKKWLIKFWLYKPKNSVPFCMKQYNTLQSDTETQFLIRN